MLCFSDWHGLQCHAWAVAQGCGLIRSSPAARRAVPSVVLVGRALAGLGAPFEHLYRGGIDLQIHVAADCLQQKRDALR
jgi:hypothetical protein